MPTQPPPQSFLPQSPQNYNPAPAPSAGKARWLKIISFLLIIAGVALIGVGLWGPISTYYESQKYADYLVSYDEAELATAVEQDGGISAAEIDETGLIVGLPIEGDPADAVAAILPDTPTPTPSPSPTPTATPVPPTATATPATDTETSTQSVAQAIPPTNTATPLPTATPSPSPTPSPTPLAYPKAHTSPNRLVIDKIELDAPVVEIGWQLGNIDGEPVSVWEVAQDAAGWHKNSALPGNRGNVVLSGHHNIYGAIFKNLVDLEPGDEVTLYADGIAYYYTIEDKKILPEKNMPLSIRERNAAWMGQFGDERLTLITCWPSTSNTHRVIIVAKPDLSMVQNN